MGYTQYLFDETMRAVLDPTTIKILSEPHLQAARVSPFGKTALRGMQNTIRQFRPKLAICVYHLFDDIIAIPRYVKELPNCNSGLIW